MLPSRKIGLGWRCVVRAVFCCAALTLLLVPASAFAQARAWTLQARIGAAVPVGDLADVEGTGLAFGIGLNRWLSPRASLRFDTHLDRLSGKAFSGIVVPDLRLYHYTAGFEVDLLDPESQKDWLVHMNAMAGASTFDFSSTYGGGTTTKFTVTGGLNLERHINEDFNAFLAGQVYIIFSGLSSGSSSSSSTSTAIDIPLTVGFRYFFL